MWFRIHWNAILFLSIFRLSPLSSQKIILFWDTTSHLHFTKTHFPFKIWEIKIIIIITTVWILEKGSSDSINFSAYLLRKTKQIIIINKNSVFIIVFSFSFLFFFFASQLIRFEFIQHSVICGYWLFLLLISLYLMIKETGKHLRKGQVIFI